MCIGNLPEGHTAVYYPTFDYAPPPLPPAKEQQQKKTLITWFRKSKKLCVSNRNIGHKIYYL